MYFDNGWAIKLSELIGNAGDITHYLSVGKIKAYALSNRYKKYKNQRLYLSSFYKHLDYAFNTRFTQRYKHMINDAMLMVNAYFEPNYAYFIDVISQCFPVDTTIQREWLWLNALVDMIYNPPDLFDYEVKQDLHKYLFIDKRRIRRKINLMPYSDFLEAIKDIPEEEIMELCTKFYGHDFALNYRSINTDVRRLFYRLTHFYQKA